MKFFFTGDIEDIEQPLHVEMPGEIGIFFTGGGEEGGQQIDLRDVLTDHLYVEHLLVHDIERDIGTGAFEQLILLTQIRSHYVGISIDAPQGKRKLYTDLSTGTNDEDLFFSHVRGFWGANLWKKRSFAPCNCYMIFLKENRT